MAPPTKFELSEEARKLRALINASDKTRNMILVALKQFEQQLKEQDVETAQMKSRLEDIERRLNK